jgi:hypothetical protein
MFLHRRIIYLQWSAAHGAGYILMMMMVLYQIQLAPAQLIVLTAKMKYATAITISAVPHHKFPAVCATSQFREEVTVDGPA